MALPRCIIAMEILHTSLHGIVGFQCHEATDQSGQVEESKCCSNHTNKVCSLCSVYVCAYTKHNGLTQSHSELL
jgi:hypothetical protein